MPLHTVHCNNCEEKELCLKLVKKNDELKKTDLMKFAKFSNDLKVENALLATLPPLNEMDEQLHTQLQLIGNCYGEQSMRTHERQFY